ncbi:hypothetical protein O181_043682 [Austropuccinia psidii MF-1]|uniref:Cytochrome b561 domain-containing protein n=1 Tax=Austropuccinia psidii MF-1 TaxID=1389203 RepID=A0A9Q3HH27_9BASI|nr:hypothetical protein [Austropuccinia psidii MF-1]
MEDVTSMSIGNFNWTASKFATSLFNAAVFLNETHAIFKLTFSILPSELGWFSVGHGTRMSNSRMMILWPTRGFMGQYDWRTAYCKSSGHTLPTLVPRSEADSSKIIVESKNPEDSLHAIIVTRPLVLSTSDILQKAPGQRLVWAMSSTPPDSVNGSFGLNFHDKGHGTMNLDLSIPTLPDGSPSIGEARVEELIHSKKHDILITLHATFLTIAWVLCAPAAIILARYLRDTSPNWVRVHWILQTLTVLLTFAGIACAAIAVGLGSHCDTPQKQMGLSVVIGMTAQAVEGSIIHRIRKRSHEKSSPAKRPLINTLHSIFGRLLTVFAWVTIAFGIKEWEFLGRSTPFGTQAKSH